MLIKEICGLFDRGLIGVQRAYGKYGYIEVSLNPAPEFDDTKREVTFKIAVKEGRQYRMGSIEFKGVSPADAAALKERWKLKAGDVYDMSYSDRFFREDAAPLLSRIYQERHAMEKRGAPVDIRSSPNRKNLTVDVVVEIKD